MKKQVEPIVTTITHSRKGNCLHIKDVTGTIRIIGQKMTSGDPKHGDVISIEVTGTADAHDNLRIQGTKGQVHITGQSATFLTPVSLCISVPSGISVNLENVGGTVAICETVEVLTVADNQSCQIFTELIHGAMLRVGGKASIKIRNLIGPCDIVALEKTQIEVRESHITTLSAVMFGDAQANLNGSACFAKLRLESKAYFRIDTIEMLIERHKAKTAILQLGWIRLPDEEKSEKKKKTDEDLRRETARREQIKQAREKMAQFSANFTPDVTLPLAVNA